MERLRNVLFCGFLVVLGISLGIEPVQAHYLRGLRLCKKGAATQAAARAMPAPAAGISGQGKMRFKVMYSSDHLPEPAVKVLQSAHGGFAIDRREGKGETYFALPGAGILRISADLKSIRLLDTAADVKDTNMHNTTFWHGSNGNGYLTFPADRTGHVHTTDLEGKLVHTLNAPGAGDDFDQAAVNDYFGGQGNFVPTDVEELDGLFYVATGYSSLDYVLTARILSFDPFKAVWHDLAFGGKGTGMGQFGTAHGITVPPGKKRLDIADRPRAEVDRFTRYGHYRSTLKLPMGSYPCDVDYVGKYGVVGCLHGPDRSKGAPIYIFEHDKLVSTVMPKADLGLENFTHIHNAVMREIQGKYYLIVQAWNPGDFAILEQVTG